MRAVSDAWKVAQVQPIVPESFIQISYLITDPQVQGDGSAAANGEAGFSSAASVMEDRNRSVQRYATAEHNMWQLDGRMKLLPNATPYGDTGFVSSVLSGADGSFGSTKPTVTITLGSVHQNPIPGITITWNEAFSEYPTAFTVRAYNGSTLVASKAVQGNRSVITEVEMELVGFNRVTIQIDAWCLPYHRARMTECIFGILRRFTKTDLLGFEHTQSVDLLSGALPKNAITFKLDNSQDIWNPENPSAASQYLLSRQEIKVKYGFKINDATEWIDAGTFYMSEWDTPSNGLEASFTARDLLEFMNDYYAGPRAGTLREIALAALEQANLPKNGDGTNKYFVDSSLSRYTVDFSAETTSYTLAEILQMAANAGCCVMYQNRDGQLRIEPLRNIYGGYNIGKNTSYSHPEYTISKALKGIAINGDFFIATFADEGEIQTLDNPLIQHREQAAEVAQWVQKYLGERKHIKGEFRADPRLDALDKVAVESKYGTNNAVVVTELHYTYGGAFRASYEGRIVTFEPEVWYSAELIAGEV